MGTWQRESSIEQQGEEGVQAGPIDLYSNAHRIAYSDPYAPLAFPRELLEIRVNKTLPFKLETAIKVRPPGADTTTKRTPARR